MLNRTRHTARRGYTLSEMLVVLGVLVVVAALAQPALRSALGDSRLRSASRDVRAALAKCRLKAMQSGVAQRFRYQVGKSRYEIAPASFDSEEQQTASAADAQAALAAEAEATGQLAAALRSRAIEQDLPQGVCFETVEEQRTASVDEEGWSEPIVFYPNGRTTSAQIRLRGERDAVVDVSLRGLTGVATAGKPRHEEALR